MCVCQYPDQNRESDLKEEMLKNCLMEIANLKRRLAETGKWTFGQLLSILYMHSTFIHICCGYMCVYQYPDEICGLALLIYQIV